MLFDSLTDETGGSFNRPHVAAACSWSSGLTETFVYICGRIRSYHWPMSRLERKAGERGPAAGVFATTHWSVVVRAQDSQSPEVTSALERLCQTYWYPLYVFVRRKGYTHEDAS